MKGLNTTVVSARLPDNLVRKLDEWCKFHAGGERSTGIEKGVCQLLGIKYQPHWNKDNTELYR